MAPGSAAAMKDSASFGDVALAAVVSQDSIMADADQARGQQMKAEAADELAGREAERLNYPALSVIAIAEGDAPGLVIEAEDAPVAQGDAVRVVGEVTQHLLRPPERTFGKDHPTFCIEQGEPLPTHGMRRRKQSRQAQDLGLQKPVQSVQKLSAEQGRPGAHWEKEFALLGRAPMSAIVAQGAADDDAVEVGMEIHLLAPGVKDQAQAQLAAQPLASKFQEALRSAIEEQRIKLRRVEKQQRVEFAGQREDAVIIGNRQQTALLLLKPLAALAGQAARAMAVSAGTGGPMLFVTMGTLEDAGAQFAGATSGQSQ